jgi:hypothetical protein
VLLSLEEDIMFARSALRPDATLAEVLVQRARSSSDRRLALDAGVGIVAALALGWWRPAGWMVLVSIAIGFAAFGGWGIADRELNEGRSQPRLLTAFLKAVEIVSVAVAVVAAIVVTFHLFALLLGRWIS